MTSEFSLAAELIADTINDLLSDRNWNHKSVYSDMMHEIPNSIPLSDEIPFAKATKLSVEMLIEDSRISDVYVDDFIMISPDRDDTLERIKSTNNSNPCNSR